jgi:hypothetical protein
MMIEEETARRATKEGLADSSKSTKQDTQEECVGNLVQDRALFGLVDRRSAVDFAFSAQMPRELVTDEVGEATRLTLHPFVESADSTVTFGS